MRLSWVFLLLFGFAVNAQAIAVQKPATTKGVIIPKVVQKQKILPKDSSIVKLRKVSESAVEEYSKQREFIYDDITPPATSWWTKFWRWFWHSVGRILGNGVSGGIIKYIFIAILILLVVYGVVKIIGLDLRLLAGKSKMVEIPYEESLENIHEIDFDSQLVQAIDQGNYRLAVRLLYLRTLKQLSDRQKIDWKIEKTNQTYVAELSNEHYKEEFAELTDQFEYIWYGEFYIDKNNFEPINQSFHLFYQKTV